MFPAMCFTTTADRVNVTEGFVKLFNGDLIHCALGHFFVIAQQFDGISSNKRS